jgi:hypothetical protein
LLSEDVNVIEHIIVRSPEVFFERNEAGKNNLEKLGEKRGGELKGVLSY